MLIILRKTGIEIGEFWVLFVLVSAIVDNGVRTLDTIFAARDSPAFGEDFFFDVGDQPHPSQFISRI